MSKVKNTIMVVRLSLREQKHVINEGEKRYPL